MLLRPRTLEDVGTDARVTVVVPARDIEGFIGEALESLIAQTFTDWQAIVVDDGSFDMTGDIARALARIDTRLRIVHNARPEGLGAARNRGVQLAESEYLAFLDGDDVFERNALETWVSTLDRSGSDFAMAAYTRLREQPDGTYAPGRIQPWVGLACAPPADGITLAERPEAVGNVVAWSKMYRTDFWRTNSLAFPGGAYEDQVLAMQVYTRAKSFDTLLEPLVRWRLRPGSITAGRDNLTVLREYLKALGGGLAVLLATHNTDALSGRIRLIRSIDLPPLEEIALTHPDPSYASELTFFLDWLATLPGAAEAPADPWLTEGLAW